MTEREQLLLERIADALERIARAAERAADNVEHIDETAGREAALAEWAAGRGRHPDD